MDWTRSLFTFVLDIVGPCLAFDINYNSTWKCEQPTLRHYSKRKRKSTNTYELVSWSERPPKDWDNPQSFHMGNNNPGILDVDNIQFVQYSRHRLDSLLRMIPKRCSTVSNCHIKSINTNVCHGNLDFDIFTSIGSVSLIFCLSCFGILVGKWLVLL